MTKIKAVVFDLDDTIYPELDFKKSAFKKIKQLIERLYDVNENDLESILFKKKGDVFSNIAKLVGVPSIKESLIWYYRLHSPSFNKKYEAVDFLKKLTAKGSKCIILTDGYSITQRLKLEALNLKSYECYISEEYNSKKPDALRYEIIQSKYPNKNYYYIADNPIKDFYAPNLLGWKTILIKNEWETVHSQSLQNETKYNPKFTIKKINEILHI